MKALSQLQIFEDNFYVRSRKNQRLKNVDMIRTVSHNQQEIIAWIQKLYGITRFDFDCTYNKGSFYRNGIGAPRFKADIIPLERDVMAACATAMPFRSGVLESIVFDPPFFPKGGSGSSGKFRYGTFDSLDNLWSTYKKVLSEGYRVLKPQGYFIFKCQDFITGRQQFLIHSDIIKFARSINFYPRDLFIKLSNHVPIAWNHDKQNHARKFHCYFIVLQKKIHRVRFLNNDIPG